MIQRVGPLPVWMTNRAARRSVALSAGETWPLELADSGRWTVHFGPQDEAHRFLRILVPRLGPAERLGQAEGTRA